MVGRRFVPLSLSAFSNSSPKVRDQHREAIFSIFNELSAHYAEDAEAEPLKVLSVTVYGELFGGIYPHPEVTDLGLL